MNIVLINPPDGEVYGGLQKPDHPHIGLAYIGAVLERAGHSVRLIDIDAEHLTEAGLRNQLRDRQPGLVGITATTPLIHKAMEIAALVKQEAPETRTVIGGIHPTLAPEECVRNPAIDYVVVGEGEQTIVELVEAMEKNAVGNSIEGLAWKRDGVPVVNNPRPHIQDLDTLPFPARHLFLNHRYSYPDALYYPTFPIVTSRGCPGKCTFCCTTKIHGRSFRQRSARNIADEVEGLVTKHGAKEIHIWDDNFITNRKRVFDLRDEIVARKIKVSFAFPNGLRPDFVREDILLALRDMGTYSIALGVESGSQEVLRHIGKGITPDRIREAFRIARKVKMEIWGFFMLGLPGDTLETIEQTVRFAMELDPDIAKFHIFIPFPGSEAYHELREAGRIIDFDYRHYGIHTPPVHELPGISRDDLNRLQKSAYRRFYFRPRVLIKQVLRLKSWNRLKLNFMTGRTLVKSMFSRKDT